MNTNPSRSIPPARRRSVTVALAALALAACASGGATPNTAETSAPATDLPDAGASVPIASTPASLPAPATCLPGTLNAPALVVDGESSLNDRLCLPDSATVAVNVPSGVAMFEVSCEAEDVWIAALRDQLLVHADSPIDIRQIVTDLGRLGIATAGVTEPIGSSGVYVVAITNPIDAVFVTDVIPTLQGVGYRVDLNYLEPVLPQYGFKPGDNPMPAGKPGPVDDGPTAGEGARVLVVDSPAAGSYPANATTPYKGQGSGSFGVRPPVGSTAAVEIDADGNGLPDEDHGHGVFVASLIERHAPAADVVLQGVGIRTDATIGGHPAPLWFSDSDLIAAIDSATSGVSAEDPFDVMNLSLGGPGCAPHANRLALASYLAGVVDRGVVQTIVASAGNDGTTALTFPAAFTSANWWSASVDNIQSKAGAAASASFAALQQALQQAVTAVGSMVDGGKLACYSNHGSWVNAWAPGTQVARYQTPTGDVWASWSGTSFAAARWTASVINEVTTGMQTTAPTTKSTAGCP